MALSCELCPVGWVAVPSRVLSTPAPGGSDQYTALFPAGASCLAHLRSPRPVLIKINDKKLK